MNGVAALLAIASCPALAGRPNPPPAASPADPDAAALSSLAGFVDGVAAQQIASREVAGMVVTVVHRGQVLFARGYGWADVERRVPVDGTHTLFRPGSVSKLFTWLALMQQVEAGRVRLDADVNDYLDFRIPATQPGPIRVRDLLNHTPGFEDRAGITVDSPAKFVPLGRWLRDNIPNRVRPAGVEIAYSNYGTALAGYIVERVTGTPFPDYVDRAIFAPLGMRATTFREPLTGAMAQAMATAYGQSDGRFAARPFELYQNVMPAGSASASGGDMARFMIAVLEGGRSPDGRQIIGAATLRAMQTTSFANAPDLPGFAHGFMVIRESGPRLIGHGGNTSDFRSFLLLAPESRTGVFISATGGPGSYVARTEMLNAIIGWLWPQAPAPRWRGQSVPPIGTYRINRRDYRLPPQPGHDVKVYALGANNIVTEAGGQRRFWEQIAPDRYELVTGVPTGGPYEQLQFHGPADDRRLSFGALPHVLFRRVAD